MVDKKILAKIQRAYHCKARIKKPSGKVYEYRLWRGYWWEDGRPKKVYLGRELPDEIKELIRNREPSKNKVQYSWPHTKRCVHQGDPGIVQVRGN